MRIGYLPGEFHIWPTMRSARSLGVLAALGGGDRVAARRRQLAERFDLDLSRRVGDLSKGNRQKVGLIYAFQHEPEVLILDEPTAGLDPLMRQAALDLIRETAEQGATVLLSSHDLGEVARSRSSGHPRSVGWSSRRRHRSEQRAPADGLVRRWALGARLPPHWQAGVSNKKPGTLDLAVSAADPILKWLSEPSSRIATPQMSLEDAFIHTIESRPRVLLRGRVASQGGDA